jgi:hypothetical protein
MIANPQGDLRLGYRSHASAPQWMPKAISSYSTPWQVLPGACLFFCLVRAGVQRMPSHSGTAGRHVIVRRAREGLIAPRRSG